MYNIYTCTRHYKFSIQLVSLFAKMMNIFIPLSFSTMSCACAQKRRNAKQQNPRILGMLESQFYARYRNRLGNIKKKTNECINCIKFELKCSIQSLCFIIFGTLEIYCLKQTVWLATGLPYSCNKVKLSWKTKNTNVFS